MDSEILTGPCDGLGCEQRVNKAKKILNVFGKPNIILLRVSIMLLVLGMAWRL